MKDEAYSLVAKYPIRVLWVKMPSSVKMMERQSPMYLSRWRIDVLRSLRSIYPWISFLIWNVVDILKRGASLVPEMLLHFLKRLIFERKSL